MTSYFVAGASRGIGLELVCQLLKDPDVSVIFAGVRSPEKAPKELQNDKVKILKLDVTHQEDVTAAADSIKKLHGSLDILIVNAGAGDFTEPSKASVEALRNIIELNTLSTQRIVLATLPLIRSGKQKKIIAIGTAAGSFKSAQAFSKYNLPSGIYGVSKAALHFLVMLYGTELAPENIIAASIHPGFVDTDPVQEMLKNAPEGTQDGYKKLGVKLLSREESAVGILATTKKLGPKDSGYLFDWEGNKMEF